jgi:hypothetical protein
LPRKYSEISFQDVIEEQKPSIPVEVAPFQLEMAKLPPVTEQRLITNSLSERIEILPTCLPLSQIVTLTKEMRIERYLLEP